MELIRSNLLKVSIIEKSGKRIWLNPSNTPWDVIEEKIKEAMEKKIEIRWYYLPKNSFEIIKTAIPPGYEQPWHSHYELHEAMLVIKGQVIVSEEREGKSTRELLCENDFVIFDSGQEIYHTMKNAGQEYALTLSCKFLGPDAKNEQLFKTDWHGKYQQ